MKCNCKIIKHIRQIGFQLLLKKLNELKCNALPRLLVLFPQPASTESMISMCVLVSVWLSVSGEGLPSIG